jgi:hypothetical protein
MSELREFVKNLERRFTAKPETEPDPLETVLKGQAIELWSTAAGRFFLVADEADARQAVERFGSHRGEVYTAAEARRVIAVNDPAVVAEIHAWKQQFDGIVRDFRRESLSGARPNIRAGRQNRRGGRR